MQRYNPFQAEPYENSSSWGADLNRDREMAPMSEKRDTNTTSAEELVVEDPESQTSDASGEPTSARVIFQ